MNASNNNTIRGTWDELNQGIFPWVDDNIGELDDKHRLFMAVCEAVINPREFDYAKWKGNGRPPCSRLKIFKAFLLKAVLNVKDTKEFLRMIRAEPLSRRLCGWDNPGLVPSASEFSRVFGEFAERGFTDKWFAEMIVKYHGDTPVETVSYDSAPVEVRTRAANVKRRLARIDPDQPPPPSPITIQGARAAEVNMAELPVECEWGCKRDSQGKKKQWKGGKIHAAVTRDGVPIAVKYTSASMHDSQAMIPLAQLAAARVPHLFDLADAAYDAEPIRAACAKEGRAPSASGHDRRRRRADAPHALLTAHARKWARTPTATALNVRIARASFVSDLAFHPHIGKSRVDGQSERRQADGLAVNAEVLQLPLLAFTKNSVSVLENVIYAHDAEKKWVQKHPAINYEIRLLSRALVAVNAKYAKNLKERTIFCEAALGARGVAISGVGGLKLRYLCDGDILFLLKNVDDDSANKYMSRENRYLPLWKSEAEFCALFSKSSWASNDSGKDLMRLKYVFESLMKMLTKNGIAEVNRQTVEKLAKDADEARKVFGGDMGESKTAMNRACIWGQKNLLCEFVKLLKMFAKKHKTPFHFQLFEGRAFSSGFSTDKLPKLLIELGVSGGMVEFGKITSVLESHNDDLPAKVYYLFGEKWNGDKCELAVDLVRMLKDFVAKRRATIDQAFFFRWNG